MFPYEQKINSIHPDLHMVFLHLSARFFIQNRPQSPMYHVSIFPYEQKCDLTEKHNSNDQVIRIYPDGFDQICFFILDVCSEYVTRL